ncbi:MAG: hypothetical protein WBH22_17420 [Pseudomonas mandelii]|uniref:hypothetical protein n=1 Tax=Pseudomonas mandelii TaxID=75612 RepID=UPI003C709D1E
MQEQETTILQTQAPTEAELAWLAHAQAEQQKTPERIEETAKYLAGIIAISLTIFIDKRPDGLAEWTSNWLTTSAVLWGVAALVSLFVLLPWRYRYKADNPASIEMAFGRVTKVKYVLLWISVICYLVALGLGVYVFIKGWS